MALVDIIAKTQEFVKNSADPLDKTNHLGPALTRAIETLNKEYSAGASFKIPIAGAEQYSQIFSQISSDFSELFREMNSMRSSSLPYSLANEVPTASGELKTFEELTSEESFLESYENTFLRMLGMPSSLEYELFDDDKLFAVQRSGSPYDSEKWLKRADYEIGVLDARQLSIDSRPYSSGPEIYNFLTSANPYDSLIKAGFRDPEGLSACISALAAVYNISDAHSDEAKGAADKFSSVHSSVSISKDKVDNQSLFDYHSGVISGFVSSRGPRPDGSNDSVPNDMVDPLINAILFTIDPGVYSGVSEDTKSSLKTSATGDVDDVSLASLNNPANFWRFSRLLFPPVHDGRISGCINEVDKIVAEPFLPSSMRKINGKTMRSSLLEAILRIRIDAIAGTTNTPPAALSQAPGSLSGSQADITFFDIAENYGVIESLIIVRLFNAICGIGIDVNSKIKDMLSLQSSTGIVPSGSSATEGERNNKVVKISSAEEYYNSLKAVDDAMLFMLGETGPNESIDYQEGVSRSSGLKNSHLFDSIISVITVNSKWADKQIGNIRRKKTAESRGPIDAARDKIDKKIGITQGVGVIDVLSFVIAMFSVPEATLIGLLTNKQKDYMKLEFPSGFFDDYFSPGNPGAKNMSDAINEMSEAAYDAYELFRTYTKSQAEDEGFFVYDGNGQ